MRPPAACESPSSSRRTSPPARRRARRGSSTAACATSSSSTCRSSARRWPSAGGCSSSRRTSSRWSRCSSRSTGLPFLTKAFYDAGLTLYDILGARHDGGWHKRLDRAADAGDRAVAATRTACAAGCSTTTGWRTTPGTRWPSCARPSPTEAAPIAVTRVRATGIRSEAELRHAHGLLARDQPDRRGPRDPDDGRHRCRRGLGGRSVAPVRQPGDAHPAQSWRPPRRAALAHPGDGGPDDPGPGQDRVPRAVAGPLADRDDRRAVRRVRRTARPPTAGRSTSCSARSTRRWTSTCSVPTSSGRIAGLRPLIAPSGGSTVKASREHRVTAEPSGVVRIGGGKYTTYRVMARDVVDAALGREVAKQRPSETAEHRLIGAADRPVLDRLAGETRDDPRDRGRAPRGRGPAGRPARDAGAGRRRGRRGAGPAPTARRRSAVPGGRGGLGGPPRARALRRRRPVAPAAPQRGDCRIAARRRAARRVDHGAPTSAGARRAKRCEVETYLASARREYAVAPPAEPVSATEAPIRGRYRLIGSIGRHVPVI